jgi:Ca-activated chloride channel family protein
MLAEDVKPNRLERAKLAIRELAPLLQGDRIGLTVFAGTAFVQCPLTTDYGAFLLTLEEAGPDLIPRGGTAVGEAIRESLRALAAAAASSRALVLITDGEDHEGDAAPAAEAAAKAGVIIFAIGIGTPEGELIPVADERGHRSFLKDREGRTVKSRLDEPGLRRLALAAGGSSIRATSTDFGLERLYRERISAMAQEMVASARRKHDEHRFQWFLAAGLLLLALEPLLSDRRRAADERVRAAH